MGYGFVITGIALLLIFISFSQSFMILGAELHKTCPLPPEVCPYNSIPWQGIVGSVISVGLILLGILLARKERKSKEEVIKTVSNREDVLKGLGEEEKSVYDTVVKAGNLMFQSELIEKTGFSKVKVSRILDRLEAKGLVERRRRGMTNAVVLK